MVKPTYFLPPNFDFPPGGPLKLGQLIANVDDPGTPISSSGPESLILNNVEVFRNRKEVKTHGYSTLTDTNASLFIDAVHDIGVLKGGLNWSQQQSNDILSHIKELDVQFIQPSDEYVKKSMMKEDVQKKLKSWFWNKRAFMITGLCTAYPAENSEDSVLQQSGRARSAGADVSLTGPAGGETVGGGGSVGTSGSQSYILDIIPRTPFIYGFQLRTCRYGKRRIKHRPYTDGAKFTDEISSSERQIEDLQQQSPDDYEFVWYEFADEDLGLEELGEDGKGFRLEEALDEATGNRCNYVTRSKQST